MFKNPKRLILKSILSLICLGGGQVMFADLKYTQIVKHPGNMYTDIVKRLAESHNAAFWRIFT
jgi:hypothetical protein